jgi:hypothetical protein
MRFMGRRFATTQIHKPDTYLALCSPCNLIRAAGDAACNAILWQGRTTYAGVSDVLIAGRRWYTAKLTVADILL